jgi:hypothetical protein
MKNLMTALFKAKQQFPIIPKNKTGRTGNQTYKYSDLGDILDLINPKLWEHGLFITQPIIGSDVVTKIIHAESGEVESYPMTLPVCSDVKEYGAVITYFRRYAICAALGVITEEDTDGVDRKPIASPTGTQKPLNASVGTDPGKHKITGGKFGGMTIAQASDAAGIFEFNGYVEWCAEQKNQSQNMLDFLANAEAFLKSREVKKKDVPGKN